MSSTEVQRTAAHAGGGDVKELRNFGLIVGGVFGVIGMWPMVFRGTAPRWWALAVTVALVLPALLAPRILAPAQRVWMGLAEILGWINTLMLLGVVFYLVVTPMGLVMRLMGKDSMRRGFDRVATTYRVHRGPRPATHMMRQF